MRNPTTPTWHWHVPTPHRPEASAHTVVITADGFLGSALARGVASHPHFTGLTVQRFTVDEATTARTQPGLTVVAGPALVGGGTR